MPIELRDRHQFHAGRFEPLRIVAVAATYGDSAIAQLLQALTRRRHSGTKSLFDLALRRRVTLGLDGRSHHLQLVMAFDRAHQDFMAPVIVAVACDVAVEPDAIDQQVDVLVLRVIVPRDQVLVVVQSHAMQVALADLDPLRIRQVFARSGRQRDV